MIASKSKYLSYFWNRSGKTEMGESTVNEESSLSSTIFSVLFCFVIVIGASYGLSTIEKIANNKESLRLFAAEAAFAAEPTSQAQLVYPSSLNNIDAVANSAVTIDLQFKNTGDSVWTKDGVYLKALTNAFKFQNSNWTSAYVAAKMRENAVQPGETANVTLTLQAPGQNGGSTGEFFLMNNEVLMPGGDIIVNLNVKNGTDLPVDNIAAPASPLNPIASRGEPQICTLKLKIADASTANINESCVNSLGLPANGPLIKVGLFHTPDPISILNDQGWQIFDDQNKLLATVPAGKKITFAYSLTAGTFNFTFENEKISTKRNLILKNFNNGVFTIASLTDKNKKPAVNFNKFSGDLSINFFDKKDRVWVVNKLPLEDYLKGLKETSDNDPVEYQKSIIVAARTYALYHMNRFFGQANSTFDVYATSSDQVFKGLNNAVAMPHLAQIVDSTRGIVASYSDNVILAYYSARSGGKTVAVKNVPYLQSVAAPYTKSMKKWGHGMGIDMYDARERTKKDNWTYDQILNYYYTGINLQKIY